MMALVYTNERIRQNYGGFAALHCRSAPSEG